MTKEEILHLGALARIKLTDEEAEAFKGEISNILGYVGEINTIVADASMTKRVGPVHNVWREDEVTNEPGTYSDALLKEMPLTHGKYLRVKKILNPDE